MNNSTFSTYNGMIVLYDGTIVYIEDQQYSPDGISNWESIFNPYDHISTNDGVSIVSGHRFKRVKHSGDTNWQLPYRIIPDEIEFRVYNNYLQSKLASDTDNAWTNIIDMDTLKGENGLDGEQGIPGEGLNIDIYGYYTSRPDCNSTITSGCTTCNNSNTIQGSNTTFMSIGDGTLILTQALITAGTVTVDAVVYTHFSNDLVTWTPISSGIVDFEARYLATDGTGAVYVDMRYSNYYGTRGNIYACADGRWILLNNIAVPSYMIRESAGSNHIDYLDGFVYNGLDFLSNTIGLYNGKLEIVALSITEAALATSVAGDGLTIPNPGDAIKVNVSDFTGFGLSTYTSDADGELDIQVNILDFIGNGLTNETILSVDGEIRNLIISNVSDIVSNDSGLISFDPGDGYYDLKVNLGNGLILDGNVPQGITIDVDDLSLIVDVDSLRIKPYSAGNDGVMLQHLNPDVIWTNRGLGLDTVNGLYARVDNLTIGYDGSGNLEVPFNAITGDRLNDNVANNLYGIELVNDMLQVRVDGTTISFNPSGQLQYVGVTQDVVTSIGAGGANLDGDILLTVISTNGSINPVVTGNAVAGTLNIDLDIDDSYLANYLNANLPGIINPIWGAITGTITDQIDLVNYISGLNHSVLNIWYDNTRIDSNYGLVLRASSGETFRVIVDAQGNLDTLSVTL